MKGFKSFAPVTEILFDKEMNMIVGPNGSGKSNITDALCFVLGRLSIKSIRAAKAANLLFSGSKSHKPSHEASVELIFDNSNKTFASQNNEVKIKRTARKNGQSVYKINNETKTRQELLELLIQAGIDPYGFNIILQGEIASLIKINSEERRKIIENVAGISIYESRKQKSLREMEKTEERLKEVHAILREKNIYLRNLERERQEALNYKKLEQTLKKCKATLINKSIKADEKYISHLNKLTEEQNKEIEKIKKHIKEKRAQISEIEAELSQTNKLIQESTGNEQESLHKELAELKAELAGLNVRKENFESRLEENKEKTQGLKQKIKQLEQEISEAKISSPKIKKHQQNQKQYQEQFDELEKQRRKFYVIKSELSTLQDKKTEKQKFLIGSTKEIELIEKNISLLFEELKQAKSSEQIETIKHQTKQQIEEILSKITESERKMLELEKQNAVFHQNIAKENKLKQDIPKMDVCPLCKSKITQEHIKYVLEQADEKLKNLQQKYSENAKKTEQTKQQIQNQKTFLKKLEKKLNEIQIDLIKLKNADDKKEQIKKITQQQNQTRANLENINAKISNLKKQFENLKNIEERYDDARLKLQELSFGDIDLDTDVAIKQRELNRLNMDLKSLTRDSEESEQELKKITRDFKEDEEKVAEKEKQEQELYEKAQKLFSEKNELQDKQKTIETDIIGLQHETKSHEERINQINIQKAEINAKLESLQSEFKEFEGIELISGAPEQLKEKLELTQNKLNRIGSVNMRALEVYEKVKEQCQLIEQKVAVIKQEKEKIQKIIQEIDKKKRKSFLKTLEKVNEYFTRNFSQLSKKGQVFLDLEDKQEPFEAGLNIILKVARGKYFDISSLSGGEKTLVALSLIFAIQEYNPYHFYIFDEIDAALDKQNSERLAALIRKYRTTGQYIIITHNDALISEASTLYGISMQENISKIVSLKV